MAEPGKQIDPRVGEMEQLQRRLLAVAVNLFKGRRCYDPEAILPGTAKSAKELTCDIILKLFKSGKWHPGTGGKDIFPLAVVWLTHAFYDLIGSDEFKLTVINESEEGAELENRASSKDTYQTVAPELIAKSLQRYLGNDQKAKDLLDIVREKGIEKCSDIAEALGVTVQEVTNIQRRLHYKLAMWERLWERKDQH